MRKKKQILLSEAELRQQRARAQAPEKPSLLRRVLQGVRRSGGAPALAQTLAALREEVRLPFRELLGLCCCNACCGTRGRVARRRCWIDSLYAGGKKTRLVINEVLSLQQISVLRHGGSSTTAGCRAKVPQKLDPTADMLLQSDTWDADAHRWQAWRAWRRSCA